MKAMDILCASPAATAISPSLEQISVVRQRSQPWFKEGQCSTALEPRNSLTEELRSERPRRNTKRRPSNTDQNARGIEPSPRGIEEKPRRSTHRGSNSISYFSCSAIDQLAVVPYQPYSPAPGAVKKSPSAKASEVVVLRVSLHCQGCAGKVRKHISKMEGVTSFSIDLPKQKVTVVGNMTPLEVLQSISRVKNAEFWSSSKNKN